MSALLFTLFITCTFLITNLFVFYLDTVAIHPPSFVIEQPPVDGSSEIRFAKFADLELFRSYPSRGAA